MAKLFYVSSTLSSRLPSSHRSLGTTQFPSACLFDFWPALGPLLSWVESSFLDSAPTLGHHVIHVSPVSTCTMISDTMALTHCPVPRTSLPGCPLGTSGSLSHWPQNVFILLLGKCLSFRPDSRMWIPFLPPFLHYHLPALT